VGATPQGWPEPDLTGLYVFAGVIIALVLVLLVVLILSHGEG